MCYITAHDKLLPTYVDYESSGGDIVIPKNETTAKLESLDVTLNFIDCWLKHFHPNFQVKWKMYNEAMKTYLKKYPVKNLNHLVKIKNTSFY